MNYCPLGISNKERILLVVHCYKEGDTIRIISARKATAREKNNIRSKNEKRNRFYKCNQKSLCG
ncbi:BrnT family toxin [Helicobacter burdigaliensis]|uniref:BrnT family toxin n=1 Tax=Helicobacter burdigaliensis TaxID=2315334 RepID=UPI000EF6E4B2